MNKLSTWLICNYCSRAFQGRIGLNQLRSHEVTHEQKEHICNKETDSQTPGNSGLAKPSKDGREISSLQQINKIVKLKELKILLDSVTMQCRESTRQKVDISENSSIHPLKNEIDMPRRSGRSNSKVSKYSSVEKYKVDLESEEEGDLQIRKPKKIEYNFPVEIKVEDEKEPSMSNSIRRRPRIVIRPENVPKSFPWPTPASFLKKRRRQEAGLSYQCDYCDKTFTNNIYNYKLHLRIHTGERPHVCFYPGCNKSYTRIDTLNKHKVIHLDIRPFQCPVCQRGFNNSSTFRQHIPTHSAECNFQCEVCGKKLKQLRDLKVHMRIHTGEKPFGCKICDKKFTSSTARSAHEKRHTADDTYLTSRAVRPFKPFTCECCGVQCFTELSKAKHVSKTCKRKLKNLNLPEPTENVKCLKCGDMFSNKLQHRKHKCSILRKSIRTRRTYCNMNVLRHKTTDHCEKCGVIFEKGLTAKNHNCPTAHEPEHTIEFITPSPNIHVPLHEEIKFEHEIKVERSDPNVEYPATMPMSILKYTSELRGISRKRCIYVDDQISESEIAYMNVCGILENPNTETETNPNPPFSVGNNNISHQLSGPTLILSEVLKEEVDVGMEISDIFVL